jgi:hypothetical protein
MKMDVLYSSQKKGYHDEKHITFYAALLFINL